MPERRRCRNFKSTPFWWYSRQLGITPADEQPLQSSSHIQVQVTTLRLHLPYVIEQTEWIMYTTSRKTDHVAFRKYIERQHLAHSANVLEFSCMTNKRYVPMRHIQEHNRTLPTQRSPSRRIRINTLIPWTTLTIINGWAAAIHGPSGNSRAL